MTLVVNVTSESLVRVETCKFKISRRTAIQVAAPVCYAYIISLHIFNAACLPAVLGFKMINSKRVTLAHLQRVCMCVLRGRRSEGLCDNGPQCLKKENGPLFVLEEKLSPCNSAS
jgi:hypothetical protein